MIQILKNKYVIYILVFVIGFSVSYFTMGTKEITKTVTVEKVVNTEVNKDLQIKINELQTQLKNTKVKEKIVTVIQKDGTSTQTIDRDSEENIQSVIQLEIEYKAKEKELISEIDKLTEENKTLINKRYNNLFVTYATDRNVEGNIQTTLYKQTTIGPVIKYNTTNKDVFYGGGLGFNF